MKQFEIIKMYKEKKDTKYTKIIFLFSIEWYFFRWNNLVLYVKMNQYIKLHLEHYACIEPSLASRRIQ